MTLREKLQKIQCELKAPKNQVNNFGHYNYRNSEDILEALKPLLAQVGAYVLLNDELVNIGNRYYIKATAKLCDVEWGGGLIDKPDIIETNAFARETEKKTGMDESQITGAASSYARKYALNGLFAIDDTKDADHPCSTKTAKREEEPFANDRFSKKPKTNSKLICSVCKEAISPAVFKYSNEVYKKPLCRNCQDKLALKK